MQAFSSFLFHLHLYHTPIGIEGDEGFTVVGKGDREFLAILLGGELPDGGVTLDDEGKRLDEERRVKTHSGGNEQLVFLRTGDAERGGASFCRISRHFVEGADPNAIFQRSYHVEMFPQALWGAAKVVVSVGDAVGHGYSPVVCVNHLLRPFGQLLVV